MRVQLKFSMTSVTLIKKRWRRFKFLTEVAVVISLDQTVYTWLRRLRKDLRKAISGIGLCIKLQLRIQGSVK